jgi:tRNA nucleotidyltransferase/poly(A) polymerase
MLYFVGGAVRDMFMNTFHSGEVRRSKDIDFAVEAQSYIDMIQYLKLTYAVEVIQEDAAFGRIIGKISKAILGNPPILDQVKGEYVYADFVLCRRDGCYSDHRRPDYIEAAPLIEDLRRRDFRMNSIALKVGSTELEVIDPFEGRLDIMDKIVRFTGNTMSRISEDYLRVLRLYRFSLCLNQVQLLGNPINWEGKKLKTWMITENTRNAVLYNSDSIAKGLKQYVSEDRVRGELLKMFKYDTLKAMHVFTTEVPSSITDVLFEGKLWLEPTLSNPSGKR